MTRQILKEKTTMRSLSGILVFLVPEGDLVRLRLWPQGLAVEVVQGLGLLVIQLLRLLGG
tara:strand:+ start:24 stop:203 length:180 start_codon:yes stop_codon:yes gene_type:complete